VGRTHITHRGNKQEFLLKFACERPRKRFGLCVLNSIVTSNHIHRLVRDRGEPRAACVLTLVRPLRCISFP
jgi:putative transposase